MHSIELKKILQKVGETADFADITVCDVTTRGLFGDTPLHVVAIWGDIHAGKILLDAGANPNIPGEYSNTPLNEAIGQGNYEFAKLLLAHGASKELRNEDGLTPVDLAKLSDEPRIKEIFS